MVRVRVPATVVYKNLGHEAIALNLETGQYYGLDEVGARFWELLTTNDTVEQTRSRLLDEFSVSEEVLSSDLDRYLAELVSCGLLEIHQE